MRIAYLDALAGVSGDMLLGAFVDGGVPLALLHDSLAALSLGATLKVEKVDRSGLHATKVTVIVGGTSAESPAHLHHGHEGAHDHSHSHAEAKPHVHEQRSLAIICDLIQRSGLSEAIQARAIRAFRLLGEAEAKVHQVPLESIHFHEVGAVDAIADIVLACVAADFLQVDAWVASPLNVGGGTVQCAHGRFPVPAPATAELLRGVPTYSSGLEMELVTPTGAALLRALDCTFGPAPHLTVSVIGYGAGTRNPPGFANVLRLSLGEGKTDDLPSDIVWVLETALDDLSPQVVGYVTERALALGALDVMCSAVQMKKNRPGTLLTVLCDQDHLPIMENLLLTETSTFGIRVRQERRVCLERTVVPVATPLGPVRVKVAWRKGVELKASPEFEDCKKIAESTGQPIRQVQEMALQAYRNRTP